MKPLREALISKDKRNWASKGEKWYIIFPFSDQLRLKEIPNAIEIQIGGWWYILLKFNQIESDLDTFLSHLSKDTSVWLTTNSIDQMKIDLGGFGNSYPSTVVEKISKKKGYKVIKKGE
jgi:hypothetical protein